MGFFDPRQFRVEALELVGQAFVVDAEQMQDRRVQIVNGRDVLRRLIAELVRCAIAEGAFHARARHPDREAFRVVVAAVGAFLGSIIFGIVMIGLTYTSIDQDWYLVFLGGMLLVAVLFNNIIRKRVTGER